MASAAEMLRRLKSVSRITTLRDMVYDEMIKEEHTLIMLKEQDFLEGDIYGTGVKDTYASKTYAEEKFRQNSRAGKGNVDLIHTGAFIDSFKLNKPKQNQYTFGATDSKTPKIKAMFGNDIMGLNQEVFNKFQLEIIKPRFVRKLKDIINKK